MRTLGICLGAATISVAEATKGSGTFNSDSKPEQLNLPDPFVKVPDPFTVKLLYRSRHGGNPRQALLKALEGLDLDEFDGLAVTGRKLRNSLNLSVISEPEASEEALGYLNTSGREHFSAILSCGAETFIVYTLDSQGKICAAGGGNKCASGTGEFFLQQIKRINIGIEEALCLAAQSSRPFKVSGRCSVFCKSDITHALNRAENLGNVIGGLCEMMSAKIIELLHNVPKGKLLIVGGVSQNRVVMDFLKKYSADIFIPPEACYFEALGAALWAQKNKCKKIDCRSLFKKQVSSFGFLAPLQEAESLLSFKELAVKPANALDQCVLGLDVGSTTTKCLLLRLKDNAVLSWVYLWTNGQPIDASRNCYRRILEQLPAPVRIIGIGTTGSGRQIAGLHALTKNIINEIIAHARAAVYFDENVDTIFEIGGQDAKYTYLVNGVPCDYAMNEACSAGTGSFLEESCREDLGVNLEDISACALKSSGGPNFSDQCAAFISSDIKTAMQEGINQEGIIAGLVYSICMNYLNRVKGTRPVGKKIFMQGGVCYNKAVCLAMAGLLQKEIIVPPHPGLMGAFGVALEVKERLKLGLAEKERFDLKALAERSVEYGRSFTCSGNKQGCDRKCLINRIKIEGKAYSFGGACNKYYNLRLAASGITAKKDWVILRHKELFKEAANKAAQAQGRRQQKSIGLNLSFSTFSFFALYYNFFKKLGFEVFLPAEVIHEGIKFQGSSFCYPAALAHGFFLNLIQKNPDYLFLPQVSEIHVKKAVSSEPEHQSTCLILQAEPYYLKTAFKSHVSPKKLLSPVLNFSKGIRQAKATFLRLSRKLGKSRQDVSRAYDYACNVQEGFERRIKSAGEEFLANLEKNPQEFAVVIFGRPYNAFCPDINLGIPNKFASRGIEVIPFDFLPFESSDYNGPPELYSRSLTWAFGQMILKAASFIEQHNQLFGAYITNFSCGPDSFLLTYFKEIMKDKPSLILEIDSHTADAGINTRIEAFIDIIRRWQQLKKINAAGAKAFNTGFQPAETVCENKKLGVISSDNKFYSLFDPKIHLLIPSMGDLGTEILSAVFRRIGINASAMPVPDYDILKRARGFTSGKECLPLILTCGSLMQYLASGRDNEEITLYFMPTVGGNCRFPQYSVFIKNLIKKNQLRNVALLSLSSENGYMGLGRRFSASALKAVIISDVMDDIRNALSVLARDKEEALAKFKGEWQKIIQCVSSGRGWAVEKQLLQTALTLKKIPLKYPITEAKFIWLLGEIFIRKEQFSRQKVVESLQKRELIARAAPVLEWLYYVDYLVKKRVIGRQLGLKSKAELFIKQTLAGFYERRTKSILAHSGLCFSSLVNIKNLINYGRRHLPLELTGEPIIVIGAALSEALHSACGVISIGPFNCLPTRVTEALLKQEMSGLPFLSVEVDGNPLSPILEARLEAFCLQAEKAHSRMKKHFGSIYSRRSG